MRYNTEKVKNILMNSDLRFWRRGTVFTGLGANQVYTAERFQWAGGTITGQLTASRVVISGLNSSIVPTNTRLLYALRFAVTTAQPVLGAGASAAPWIKVEGFDILPLAKAGNGGFTYSFYVRAFRTGTYHVQFLNGATTRSYMTAFTINASDTWQRVNVFVPYLDVGNGVWDFTSGIGMYVRTWFAVNPTSSIATLNSWQANNQPPATQVNMLQSTNDYMEMTGFMLYPGQEEREFEARGESYDAELEMLRRYYQTLESIPGVYSQTNRINGYCPLPVEMRTLPVAGMTGVINFQGTNAFNITQTAPGYSNLAGMTNKAFYAEFANVPAGPAQGYGFVCALVQNNNNFVTLDAEL